MIAAETVSNSNMIYRLMFEYYSLFFVLDIQRCHMNDQVRTYTKRNLHRFQATDLLNIILMHLYNALIKLHQLPIQFYLQ